MSAAVGEPFPQGGAYDERSEGVDGMRARQPTGGGPSCDPARLQPARQPARGAQKISPIAGAALEELDLEEGDGEEQEEARIAAERLERRWEDLNTYNTLALAGFEGSQYELFIADLAAYGYPVVRSWLRRGLIFQFCAERGRPVKPTPFDRDHLMTPGAEGPAADDRAELALETNARALTFFREHVLLTGAWTVEGGASLNTFYIGGCLFAFPNVYQRWAGERRRAFPTASEDPVESPARPGWSPARMSIDMDPAVSVTAALTVADELNAMPASTRVVAERVLLEGATFAEVGAELGISERAVEGRLYRYRIEAQRRGIRGRVK